MDQKPRIGISGCLLGQEVRYNGGHKRDDFLLSQLGPHVDWVPLCPELGIGLGVPRDSIRLERAADGSNHLINPKTGADHTAAMARYAAQQLKHLRTLGLCGFVLKKNSPSCGMARVKVYAGGMPSQHGAGLFAAALHADWPELPLEEEGRLCDPHLRDHFVERIFAVHRLQQFFVGRWTLGGLVALHSALKLQILAHHPRSYTELGQLVARGKQTPRNELRAAYVQGVMRALATRTTVRKHVNVLQHMAGYFRKLIPDAARTALAETIRAYQDELVPLIVPVTLIAHYAQVHGVAYLQQQSYLSPHPRELKLRNGV